MGHLTHGLQRDAQGRQARLNHAAALGVQLGVLAGHRCEDQSGMAQHHWAHCQRRAGTCACAFNRGPCHAVADDLDSPHQSARLNPTKARQGGQCDGRINPVQIMDRGFIQINNPGAGGIQVDPSGKGVRAAKPLRHRIGHQGRGQPCGGGVFVQILRFQLRHDHAGTTLSGQGGQIGGLQHAALAQAPLGPGVRMGQNRAQSRVQGDRAELHPGLRRTWVIWASTESAISAGVLAPISRPTGAWMRAISSSENPASLSRASRLAWVFFDPRQPR